MSDASIATIGHNNPPPDPTPYEIVLKEIDDLYGEAKLWLDGATVDSQGLADGIGNLMALLRAAEKKAEAARLDEKHPYDEKIAEIQDRYNQLIGNTKSVKGKTTRALAACKKALAPWLEAERKRIEDEARKAREEADAKARAAQEALRAADPSNLEAREDAEVLVKEAKHAETVANKAARQTASAGGTFGRSVSLRTEWVATITDMREFARYVWTNHQNEITVVLPGIAQRLASIIKRDMPGVTVTEQKRAV